MIILRKKETLPSIDDVAKVLSEMDSETYNAAVHFIFI